MLFSVGIVYSPWIAGRMRRSLRLDLAGLCQFDLGVFGLLAGLSA
jgi:hypothetical protein